MTTAYSSLMGLALPVQGELSGTWGDTVNNGITNYLDVALAGTQTISGNQTAVTLSLTNGNASATNIAQAGSGATGSAQYAIINCTGNPASLLTITVPASSRQYVVINATSTSQSVKVVGVGPTTGVTIVSGEKAHIVWNGSDFVKIASTAAGAAAGSNTQVQYNSSGSLAGSANLTFDGTTLTTTGNAVISDNSSNAALRITQVGAGNALLVEDSANPDSTPFVVDSNGAVAIGTTTPITGVSLTLVPSAGEAVIAYKNADDTGGATQRFRKSRGTFGSPTIIQSGDTTGTVVFQGYDGANYLQTANISSAVDGTPGTNDMPGRLVFSTTADGASSPTERMRIDNAGQIIQGTPTGATNGSLQLRRNTTGGTTAYSVGVSTTIQSDVTSQGAGYNTFINTAASAFTLGILKHFNAQQGTIGAGSAVTSQYGYFVDTSLTGATSNYGFYSDIAAGTGRWNFYANGTAANYFSGATGVGTSTTGNAQFTVGMNTSSGTTDKIQKWDWNGGPTSWGMTLGQVHTGSSIDYAFQLQNNSSTPVTRLYLAAGGTISLGAAPGSESLRVTPVASAVNWVGVEGAIAGSGPVIRPEGSDTNIALTLGSKGTGSLFFATNRNSGFTPQFVVTHTASAVNYVQATGAATTAAPSLTATGSDTNINLSLTAKGTGLIALNNPATVLAMLEKATVSATAATGTINFDAATQPVLYYTTNSSGNWTLNIRASSTQTLDSMMATGQSLTLAFLATNGSTAYYQSALTIDGSSVTPKWQGGTAPTAGNASSIDAYVLTVIKTGSATFTVLASQTKFA